MNRYWITLPFLTERGSKCPQPRWFFSDLTKEVGREALQPRSWPLELPEVWEADWRLPHTRWNLSCNGRILQRFGVDLSENITISINNEKILTPLPAFFFTRFFATQLDVLHSFCPLLAFCALVWRRNHRPYTRFAHLIPSLLAKNKWRRWKTQSWRNCWLKEGSLALVAQKKATLWIKS